MKKVQEHVTFNTASFRKLQSVVANGEGKYLEFKRKAAHPEKIIREMIAFANTQGGTLLLGVGDDGEIPGLKYPEDESHVVHQALTHCHPPLGLTESFIAVGLSRTVIRYDIPESENKLHYLTLNGSKQAFVRVGDKSIKASREVREVVRRSQRARDIRFHYGDHERLLMQYLAENDSITLQQFMELSQLKRYKASRKLIQLVLADVLLITPHERGDLFSRADDAA